MALSIAKAKDENIVNIEDLANYITTIDKIDKTKEKPELILTLRNLDNYRLVKDETYTVEIESDDSEPLFVDYQEGKYKIPMNKLDQDYHIFVNSNSGKLDLSQLMIKYKHDIPHIEFYVK
jgi:hypothetical protein